MPRDYYSILQVNRRASQEQIERSFERLSKLYDPERSKKRRAPERWEQIQEAYNVIGDPAKRAEYDRESNTRRLPGIGGEESAVTRFLTSRWGLPSVAGIIGTIVIAAVIVAVFSGGDDGGEAVLGSPTPTVTAEPTPTTTPPPVDGEEVTTDSGLTIVNIEDGSGASPALGDTVVVNYTGWLESDNTQFDANDNTSFTLGQVIEGWNEGLQLMQEGGSARLIIPPELAYGEAGRPGIPPNSTLIFDIELLEVRPAGATPTAAGSPSPEASPSPDATASPETGE